MQNNLSDVKFTESEAYGWVMVFITFTLSAISFGVLSSVGVFLKVLEAEFGWSRASLSFGYSAITLATAATGIFWGFLADRYGTRRFVLFGAIVLGFPLLLLSTMDSIVEFYFYYFLFGAFGHATVTGLLYANVGLWFTRNIGLAIGLSVAGGAVGQGTVPVIVRYLINQHDWQTAYWTLGIAYIILAIPIALFVRDSPRRQSAQSHEAPRQRDGTAFPLSPMVVVAWIATAVVFCCIAMAVPIVHLVPLLTDKGMSPNSAVTVFFVLMITGAFGRVLGGKLADHIGALQSYICMSVLQTAVIFLFPHVQNTILIYALAMTFGLAFSGVMASFLVCVRMMIPAGFLARGMSVVGATGWIGMGLGGWQGGIAFDMTGDYVWSFAIGSIAGVINLAILAFFYMHIRRSGQPQRLQAAAA
ncbi:MAG: MFS transporter [Rhodospirillaceae bacterium]|jgi:MFS family permease|nr:MFS transporter [Rhodospirillaceae bacterium]MBT7955814.1 MFS transporter [Rhodospirillaceae bacterium]